MQRHLEIQVGPASVEFCSSGMSFQVGPVSTGQFWSLLNKTSSCFAASLGNEQRISLIEKQEFMTWLPQGRKRGMRSSVTAINNFLWARLPEGPYHRRLHGTARFLNWRKPYLMNAVELGTRGIHPYTTGAVTKEPFIIPRAHNMWQILGAQNGQCSWLREQQQAVQKFWYLSKLQYIFSAWEGRFIPLFACSFMRRDNQLSKPQNSSPEYSVSSFAAGRVPSPGYLLPEWILH